MMPLCRQCKQNLMMRKPWLIRIGHRVLVGWWWLTRPTTDGVKGLVFHHDAILLVRQSYGDRRYTIPGGGVKRTESFATAAARELHEETQVTTSLQYFGQYQQEIEYKHDTVHCFVGSVTTATAVPDGAEVTEAEWFPVTALPRDRAPSVDRILALYHASERSNAA